MATVDDWNKYINLSHELALVEDDLRSSIHLDKHDYDAQTLARRMLYERFGLDTHWDAW